MVLESQNSSFVPPHSGYPLTFSHLPLFCITWLWQLLSPSLFPSLAPALACVSALKGRGGGRGGGSAVSAGSVMREQPECLWSLSEQSLDAAAPISFDPEGIVYRLGTGIAPSPADLDGHTHTHTHIHTQTREWNLIYIHRLGQACTWNLLQECTCQEIYCFLCLFPSPSLRFSVQVPPERQNVS